MVKEDMWFWYYSDEINLLNSRKMGKWMYFFTDQEFAKQICQKAINEGVCYECKCTNMKAQNKPTGVVCFYLNKDDVDNHKRVIQFMIDNNLIQRTKTGKLYNISFKLDTQTRLHQYGNEFTGEIKLDQFVDLYTKEFII